MTDTIKLQFDIESTDITCPLSFEVFWDGVTQAHCFHVQEKEHVSIDLVDTQEAQHELRIVMSGKKPEHTQLDSNGAIVKDAMLRITRVVIDDMDITQLLQQVSIYEHDHNGHSAPLRETFFGDMGCNGTVTFRFSTPYYLWLLEHM